MSSENDLQPPPQQPEHLEAAADAQLQKREAPQFNEQTNYLPPRKIVTIFLACAAVDLVALMDQTTLAASLTIIGSALNAGRQASWIANGYFITSTSFQLLYGRLSDVWSRKLVLLAGMLIFFVGSLAASLAQSSAQLIVFRAFTGVGGGGLVTVAQIIVSDVVTLRERGKYQGILGAVVALSNGIGPVVGGALASQSQDSWRWIFRLNLPLTALTALCCIFFMPLRRVEGSWRTKLAAIDFLGAALTLAGSTLIILGFTWAGSEHPWDSGYVIGTIVAGFGVWGLFILWQWKGTALPLMPLHIFKSAMVNGACLTMFVNGWNFVVQVYYIPTFYQLAYGYSAVKSGALLLPLVLVQTFASTISGLVVTWTGRYRECILLGWTLWAIGLGLFSTLNEDSGLGKQIGYALLTGVGVGNTLQPALIAIQAGVERKDMAVVTGTRNFVRNLGATLGLAIAGTILNNTLRTTLTPLGYSTSTIQQILDSPIAVLSHPDETQRQVLAAYQKGFRIIFLVGAALAAFAFVVAALLMRQVRLDRPDDEKLKEEAKRKVEEKERRKRGEVTPESVEKV